MVNHLDICSLIVGSLCYLWCSLAYTPVVLGVFLDPKVQESYKKLVSFLAIILLDTVLHQNKLLCLSELFVVVATLDKS